jgi:hypothetical protein
MMDVKMKPDDTQSLPPCFGRLDMVFPMQADGLRHTPDACLACPHKTACLRAAAAGRDGLKLAEEKIDRAYSAGAMGFFQRWHQKKSIARKKENPIKHNNSGEQP